MKAILFTVAFFATAVVITGPAGAKKSEWLNKAELAAFEKELRANKLAARNLKCDYNRKTNTPYFRVSYAKNRNGLKDGRILTGGNVSIRGRELAKQGFKRKHLHTFTGAGTVTRFQCAIWVK